MPALVLVALTLIFFYRLAFTDLILARGDTFAYFYPYWFARSAALMSGHLPLWSPDLFMGVPLLGNSQLGTFYPPNWIVAPLSPPDGVRVSILLHAAWAALGMYLLARRSLGVSRLAALASALLFAFSGHVSAHVEQINQLQGLAWLPWLVTLFDRALARPLPNAILLGMGLALQFFTGHTQTVFITGVALAIYALCTRPLRGAITLAGAGALALLLALPQLIPTLELTRVSNRSGGLNLNQATAFSFSPFVTGRGLLPSYDAPIFAEYVAYPGVIGLGLAVVGVLSARAGLNATPTRRLRLPLSPRATWLILALVGLALAYGLYNPLYWLLGTLPGFNLFRVPARWLALFALGAAMLAGLGVECIRTVKASHASSPPIRSSPLEDSPDHLIYLAVLLVFLLLAALTALTLRQPDLTPVSLPTLTSILGWAIALAVLLLGLWRRAPLLLVGGALLELWLASQVLPYNQLVPPESYSGQRYTESLLLAEGQDQVPPGRVLSISSLLFDPGDRAALQARYDALGLSPEADAIAFDTVKMRETLAANLPLIWNIQSADGFDGGLLPTTYYSAFTALFLPQGEPRTVDGRLRELLARSECGGACIPERRWLNLMNVRFLVTDKIYDVVQDGVFFDTQFPQPATDTQVIYNAPPGGFQATAVDLLLQCASDPCPTLDLDFGVQAQVERQEDTRYDDDHRVRLYLSAPTSFLQHVRLHRIPSAVVVRAVSLVDLRTGDFVQLQPHGWTRVLSSDVKVYDTGTALKRAFLVGDVRFVLDDNAGAEAALDLMRDPTFEEYRTAIIAGNGTDQQSSEYAPALFQNVAITSYTDTRVSVSLDAPQAAYLVLTDAYYPGWAAMVNGESVPVERADVMFRAVRVPPGQSEVVFEYRPAWLPVAPIAGEVAWLAALIALFGLRKSRGLVGT